MMLQKYSERCYMFVRRGIVCLTEISYVNMYIFYVYSHVQADKSIDQERVDSRDNEPARQPRETGGNDTLVSKREVYLVLLHYSFLVGN